MGRTRIVALAAGLCATALGACSPSGGKNHFCAYQSSPSGAQRYADCLNGQVGRGTVRLVLFEYLHQGGMYLIGVESGNALLFKHQDTGIASSVRIVTDQQGFVRAEAMSAVEQDALMRSALPPAPSAGRSPPAPRAE